MRTDEATHSKPNLVSSRQEKIGCDVRCNSRSSGASRGEVGKTAERMQVKVVVFEGPPHTLNEEVALTPTEAVHADVVAVVLENFSKSVAGKLGALSVLKISSLP